MAHGHRNLRPLDAPGTVICVTTFKGGTTKTFICETLAYLMTKDRKLRVLLIDADPQGNLSMSFGVHPTQHKENLREALMGALEFNPVDALMDNILALDVVGMGHDTFLIPGGERVHDAMKVLQGRVALHGDGPIDTLKLLTDAAKERFDVILVDMPPALADLSTNMALHAADHVISPVVDPGSADGLAPLLVRVAREAGRREHLVLPALDVHIICPRLVAEVAAPIGEHARTGMSLPAWYGIVRDAFADVFIDEPVRFTRKAFGSYGDAKGFVALAGEAKKDWRHLADAFYARLLGASGLPLSLYTDPAPITTYTQALHASFADSLKAVRKVRFLDVKAPKAPKAAPAADAAA
jgi:cellulose biosynthesis protein BcsQ